MPSYLIHCWDNKISIVYLSVVTLGQTGVRRLEKMNSNYQTTTVYKYAQLLENDSSSKEASVKKAVEKYLSKAHKANVNAYLLEELLA